MGQSARAGAVRANACFFVLLFLSFGVPLFNAETKFRYPMYAPQESEWYETLSCKSIQYGVCNNIVGQNWPSWFLASWEFAGADNQ